MVHLFPNLVLKAEYADVLPVGTTNFPVLCVPYKKTWELDALGGF